MRVIGIDCGIALTGWAVLETNAESRNGIHVCEYGVVRTKAGEPMAERLALLYESVRDLVQEFKPDNAAVEALYYFKNQKTIISVGQARGVTLLALNTLSLPISDYTPLQVKQAVVGYGKADKKQVQQMVKSILGLKEIPKPDDAADAIAVAICHLQSGILQNT